MFYFVPPHWGCPQERREGRLYLLKKNRSFNVCGRTLQSFVSNILLLPVTQTNFKKRVRKTIHKLFNITDNVSDPLHGLQIKRQALSWWHRKSCLPAARCQTRWTPCSTSFLCVGKWDSSGLTLLSHITKRDLLMWTDTFIHHISYILNNFSIHFFFCASNP